jgi:hypothetical protein
VTTCRAVARGRWEVVGRVCACGGPILIERVGRAYHWPEEIRQREATLARATRALVEAREVLAYAERHLPE